ncbi:MAG: hypothetical protein IGR92_09080 [Leptolyngbyaceae cyanobacterium T60_A2020_046]|nr:hypothetical protein [Leptolyngbyaceae cyanobacterium T60_A2020_046]
MSNESPIQHPEFEAICREMSRQMRQQVYISLGLMMVIGAIVAVFVMLEQRDRRSDRFDALLNPMLLDVSEVVD